jgi:hypothetical protein
MMLMTGLYRLALHPGADAKAFERHLTTQVFTLPDALQLTRITRSFSHQLLAGTHRIPGGSDPVNPHPGPQYLWEVRVELQTSAGYDFHENADRVQQHVAQFATLIAVEAYTNIESDS